MLKWFFVIVVMGLSACSHVPDSSPVKIESTSRQDSAPTETRDLSAIKEPVPKPVTRTRAGNQSPYTVFGKTYHLLPQSQGYKERGDASWYGTKFHGRRTSNGEVYDMWAMTAAHKTLPIPSYVRVTNLSNGRSIIVRVNDRGPFHEGRIIDLSYAAASKLGFEKQGTAPVECVDITPTKSPAVVKSAPVAAPVVVTQPVVIEPATTDTILQVAAFRKQQKAVELRAKLQQFLKVPVNIVFDKVRNWHRVRVGPIKTEQALLQTRQMLAEQGISSPMPVLK